MGRGSLTVPSKVWTKAILYVQLRKIVTRRLRLKFWAAARFTEECLISIFWSAYHR